MIKLFQVNMPPDVDKLMKPILESGYITEGPITKEFEREFQEWLGNPNTAIVSSGTAALTIALRLAGVAPGDEVITSPMTCLAMNEPILAVGGVPVWCDVNPRTGNLDASKIEALISPRTKAVLFVDWGGTPADLDAINEVAHRHGLKTIEDAAHALGAVYKGKKIGTVSDFTCFSFQAIKHMTTVDGGALACSSKEDYERAVLLRWFGCKRGHNNSPIKWEGDVVEYGYKMHMSDVNAVIGLESLKTINLIIARHKANGRYLLQNIPESMRLTIDPTQTDSAFWIFTILLQDKAQRDEVSSRLLDAGIANSIVHTRNDAYSLFEKSPTPLPGLDEFSDRMLNIPCGWWVTDEELNLFVATLKELA